MGDSRTIAQDSRFGLIALSEIASRAMSPGINDPGTAIDVIGTLVRLLVRFERERGDVVDPPVHDRIWVEPLLAKDMLTDAFRPVARDGAGHVEVCIRLQKALSTLSALADGELAEAARNMADEALLRSRQALTIDADIKLVIAAHYAMGDRAGA
jgi:uncharacterized membrane protein